MAHDFLPDSGWPADRGLLLEEDHALKLKLTGLTVRDINDDGTMNKPLKQIGVWFRMPEQELRTKTFPHLLIDFLAQEVEHDREHRGVVTYFTEPYTGNSLAVVGGRHDGQPGYFPIPLRLTYQITASSRSAQHDRQIMSMMNREDLLHPRFAFLNTPSGTTRRLDVLEGPRDSSSLADDGKRLFRKVWTVAVSAELVPDLPLVTNSRVSSIVQSLKLGANPDTAVSIP